MIKYIADVFIIVALICNILEHRMLWREFEALKEWVEVLHRVDFKKISEAVNELRAKQTERDGE